MENIKNKRTSMRLFWDKEYENNMTIKSVKTVYNNYKLWCDKNEQPIINEYIFRTYIRKIQEKKKRYVNS